MNGLDWIGMKEELDWKWDHSPSTRNGKRELVSRPSAGEDEDCDDDDDATNTTSTATHHIICGTLDCIIGCNRSKWMKKKKKKKKRILLGLDLQRESCWDLLWKSLLGECYGIL